MYLGFVILALTLAFMLFLWFGAEAKAQVSFPRGFYEHGQAVVERQQEIYGMRYWTSILPAQVEQESAWERCPTSPVGARGLTQFMPGTQRAVERKHGLRGTICDPVYAATLQSYLMRELAWQCGTTGFKGIHTWACMLRTYNGSPRSFYQEWVRAGRPLNVWTMDDTCLRRREHCRENVNYYKRILVRLWPRYHGYYGR